MIKHESYSFSENHFNFCYGIIDLILIIYSYFYSNYNIKYEYLS